MQLLNGIRQTQGAAQKAYTATADSITVFPLADEHTDEALAFLVKRPVHTFVMLDLIRTNGPVSPKNRGTLYGCQDEKGRLQGVALIGHATMFEAHSKGAIEAFARVAQGCPDIHMVLGEREKVSDFWWCFAQSGRKPRRSSCELLLELRRPPDEGEAMPGLRLATADDLALVIAAHARMSLEEGGVDAFKIDAEGFCQRCATRVDQRRTWVWIENARLIFKAEIITNTPEVIYLEGVWVDPEERGKGYGLRCISHLSRILLQQASCICLLVNDQSSAAQALYRRAGYKPVSYYSALFL